MLTKKEDSVAFFNGLVVVGAGGDVSPRKETTTMHLYAVKMGLLVTIRIPDGSLRQGRAVEKKGSVWLLEGNLVATAANIVRVEHKRRLDPLPPPTAPDSIGGLDRSSGR